MKFWNQFHKLKNSPSFKNKKIISGKRIGRKLGIPTANVEVKIDDVKNFQMIPGIYFGTTKV